jgi:hypothetical protein
MKRAIDGRFHFVTLKPSKGRSGASFPEHALRAGDVATLVDCVDHPAPGPRGCVLELFNALGEWIAASQCLKTPSSRCAQMKCWRCVRWQWRDESL